MKLLCDVAVFHFYTTVTYKHKSSAYCYTMSEKWIGSLVSVDCGIVLGVFEGEISSVDEINQTISLINVSRNNVKCTIPEITLR